MGAGLKCVNSAGDLLGKIQKSWTYCSMLPGLNNLQAVNRQLFFIIIYRTRAQLKIQGKYINIYSRIYFELYIFLFVMSWCHGGSASMSCGTGSWQVEHLNRTEKYRGATRAAAKSVEGAKAQVWMSAPEKLLTSPEDTVE